MPALGNTTADRQSPEFRVSIALVMLFQVSALIIRSLVQVKMVESGFDVVSAKHLSALVGFAALGILMWPIMIEAWPAVREHFRRPASWTRMILASVTLGVVLWLGQMLALLGYSTLEWEWPHSNSQSNSPTYFFNCQNPSIFLLAIPVMSLLTPFAEEVINRGLILHTLLPRGRTTAVLVSAALFSVMHVYQTYLFALVFGILSAVQMIHYRTLWSVIITHGVVNLFVEISRNCVDGRWLPGEISWATGNATQLILLSFTACIICAWSLAINRKAGVAR